MSREDDLNNLQELLEFMPERDETARCERALVKAAAGFDNLTFVKAFLSLTGTILGANPDAEAAREQARNLSNMLISLVEMILEQREGWKKK